jgi:hypothetical protein
MIMRESRPRPSPAAVFCINFSGLPRARNVDRGCRLPCRFTGPYTLAATAETALGEPGSPTAPSPEAHACAMSAHLAHAGSGPAAQPLAHVTETSVLPSGGGIRQRPARMTEPEPRGQIITGGPRGRDVTGNAFADWRLSGHPGARPGRRRAPADEDPPGKPPPRMPRRRFPLPAMSSHAEPGCQRCRKPGGRAASPACVPGDFPGRAGPGPGIRLEAG